MKNVMLGLTLVPLLAMATAAEGRPAPSEAPSGEFNSRLGGLSLSGVKAAYQQSGGRPQAAGTLTEVYWLPFSDRGGCYAHLLAGERIGEDDLRYFVPQGAKIEFKAPGKNPAVFVMARAVQLSKYRSDVDAVVRVFQSDAVQAQAETSNSFVLVKSFTHSEVRRGSADGPIVEVFWPGPLFSGTFPGKFPGQYLRVLSGTGLSPTRGLLGEQYWIRLGTVFEYKDWGKEAQRYKAVTDRAVLNKGGDSLISGLSYDIDPL